MKNLLLVGLLTLVGCNLSPAKIFAGTACSNKTGGACSRKGSLTEIKKLKLVNDNGKYVKMSQIGGMSQPILLRITEKQKATDFRITVIPSSAEGYVKYKIEFDAMGKSWRIRGTSSPTSAFFVVSANTPFDETLDVWGHAVVPGEFDKLHNGDKVLIME